MIHEEDLKRQEDPKVRRLKLLAKACANAQLDSFKNLWYNKLMQLAKQYNMTDYVMRKSLYTNEYILR